MLELASSWRPCLCTLLIMLSCVTLGRRYLILATKCGTTLTILLFVLTVLLVIVFTSFMLLLLHMMARLVLVRTWLRLCVVLVNLGWIRVSEVVQIETCTDGSS